MKIFAMIGLVWLGWYLGWVHAHLTVAIECKRLGAFFVGDTVFHCVEQSKESSITKSESDS